MSKRDREITAIIFDLGNVLLLYDAKKAALRFSKECGVPLYKLWGCFFNSETEKAYTRGEITSLDFFEYAKKSLALEISYKKFSYYWNDIFSENVGMDHLLTSLSKKYPLYLISNTNRLHYEHIKKNFTILRHFKRKFASHELGLRKPDRAIYKTVLSKTKRDPEETIFIDDDIRFVRGAREMGIHSIHFKSKPKLLKELKACGVSY